MRILYFQSFYLCNLLTSWYKGHQNQTFFINAISVYFLIQHRHVFALKASGIHVLLEINYCFLNVLSKNLSFYNLTKTTHSQSHFLCLKLVSTNRMPERSLLSMSWTRNKLNSTTTVRYGSHAYLGCELLPVEHTITWDTAKLARRPFHCC